ncbi:MAG: hypothetical protein GYB65_21460 [Chloroflexi bacterium]|nr:hypothetical protein [Chloroflexota bacterium]
MYQSDELDVWNLTPGVTATTGAQTVFNVVGRVKKVEEIAMLSYRLNDGPLRQVFVNPKRGRTGRLHRFGDFNIDTIMLDELHAENRLVLRLERLNGSDTEHEISFATQPFPTGDPSFQLKLAGTERPEELGQIVDGKWHVNRDEAGEPCLEVLLEDAGYDRIILFGHRDWTTNYEITARISVPEWTGAVHLAGLLFKWQPHLQGDGTHLPTEWSTGLAYYASNTAGLRIHYGVDMRTPNEQDHVLAEAPLSRWRRWTWAVQYGARKHKRFGRERVPFIKLPRAQMLPGVQYRFRMLVTPQRHVLTVWRANRPEPAPQLVVSEPTECLPDGPVGIVFYHSAGRIYEFDVAPA